MDLSSVLLAFSSIMGPSLSFVLYATVFIAGWRFLQEGSVGQMTMTFYSLGCFNGCVWAVYSVLIESKTLAIPNTFALFATCFALLSYVHVLRKEMAGAEEAAVEEESMERRGTLYKSTLAVTTTTGSDPTHTYSSPLSLHPPHAMATIVIDAPSSPVSADGSSNMGNHSRRPSTVGPSPDFGSPSDNNDGGESTQINLADTKTLSTATSMTVCGLTPACLSVDASAVVTRVASTSACSAHTAAVVGAAQPTTQVINSEVSADVSKDTELPMTARERADELKARYAYTQRSAAIILGTNFLTCAFIVAVCGAGYQSIAIAISGTMGVIMENILFAGPFDEITWILKHKNSAPLDPLMTAVGAVDCMVWILYASLTNDVYLFIPNAFSVTLCLIQLGLIRRFPARSVQ